MQFFSLATLDWVFVIVLEPDWLEGDLGLRNVALRDNVIVDGTPADHVAVFPGLSNVSCSNTTFVHGGQRTTRVAGC